MLADLIVQLIFVAVVCGLLLLMLIASDQNNRAMLRFWEAVLNRVQFETRSANLPKPSGGRPSDSKSMGLELDAV